jgi:hypothetical protein
MGEEKLIIKKLDTNFLDFIRDFGGLFSGIFTVLSVIAIIPTRFSYYKSILNALFMVKRHNTKMKN